MLFQFEVEKAERERNSQQNELSYVEMEVGTREGKFNELEVKLNEVVQACVMYGDGNMSNF